MEMEDQVAKGPCDRLVGHTGQEFWLLAKPTPKIQAVFGKKRRLEEVETQTETHRSRGQGIIFRSEVIPPTMGSGDSAARLDSKHLYLLSYLASPKPIINWM